LEFGGRFGMLLSLLVKILEDFCDREKLLCLIGCRAKGAGYSRRIDHDFSGWVKSMK
jgi:hypothetical protein